MTERMIDLPGILDLETIEWNVFRGNSPNACKQPVFGGQLIGQAMAAASRTVESRIAHSIHGNFIRAGDSKEPIIYEVELLRDGKSYSTRRVTATQHGRAIFTCNLSFHAGEQSVFEHQVTMPDVPPPENFTIEVLSKQPVWTETPERIRHWYVGDRLTELRPVEIGRYSGQNIEDGCIHFWIKPAPKLPNDPALHMCALAYASDWSLLDAALARHGRMLSDGHLLAASLDHAMWFHRPCRADDWLLYVKDSPSAQAGRALARGMIFDRDGALVATVAQEGSMRERS